MICRGCGRWHQPFRRQGGLALCGMCLALLAQSGSRAPSVVLGEPAAGNQLALTSFCDYGVPLRSWVLRAKVGGDLVAVGLLGEIMRLRYCALALDRWTEVVVVAPSSAWSRLRGRIDLAHALARAACGAKPFIPAPWGLNWRWHKRALVSTWARPMQVPSANLFSAYLNGRWFARHGAQLAGRRVLIVDDVATTGFTLRALAQALAGAGPSMIRAVTLAGSSTLR